MISDVRDIPEEDFRLLARQAFRALLDEQDMQVREAKGVRWFRRPPAKEQEMFSAWLRELSVKPFPFRP